MQLKEVIRNATITVTKAIPLRPNSVDSLTGRNPGNNIGIDFPEIFFEEWNNDFIRMDLMLNRLSDNQISSGNISGKIDRKLILTPIEDN